MSHDISSYWKTVLNLEDLCDEGLDYEIDSYLTKFFIKDEDGLTTATSNYAKPGPERRKPENREYIENEVDYFYDVRLNQEFLNSALTLRSTSIEIFIALIENKVGSFRDMFCSSLWLDPQSSVADHPTNVLKAIETLIKHFTDPCKQQILKNHKYMQNCAHFKQPSKYCLYWNTKKWTENLRISKYLFVSRAGNDNVFK